MLFASILKHIPLVCRLTTGCAPGVFPVEVAVALRLAETSLNLITSPNLRHHQLPIPVPRTTCRRRDPHIPNTLTQQSSLSDTPVVSESVAHGHTRHGSIFSSVTIPSSSTFVTQSTWSILHYNQWALSYYVNGSYFPVSDLDMASVPMQFGTNGVRIHQRDHLCHQRADVEIGEELLSYLDGSYACRPLRDDFGGLDSGGFIVYQHHKGAMNLFCSNAGTPFYPSTFTSNLSITYAHIQPGTPFDSPTYTNQPALQRQRIWLKPKLRSEISGWALQSAHQPIDLSLLSRLVFVILVCFFVTIQPCFEVEDVSPPSPVFVKIWEGYPTFEIYKPLINVHIESGYPDFKLYKTIETESLSSSHGTVVEPCYPLPSPVPAPASIPQILPEAHWTTVSRRSRVKLPVPSAIEKTSYSKAVGEKLNMRSGKGVRKVKSTRNPGQGKLGRMTSQREKQSTDHYARNTSAKNLKEQEAKLYQQKRSSVCNSNSSKTALSTASTPSLSDGGSDRSRSTTPPPSTPFCSSDFWANLNRNNGRNDVVPSLRPVEDVFIDRTADGPTEYDKVKVPKESGVKRA